MGVLEDILNAQNDPQGRCLYGKDPEHQPPAWTLPGYSTFTLLYIFLAMYVAAIMSAILLASCCCKKRPEAPLDALEKRKRMGVPDLFSAIFYIVDVVSDVLTIADLIRCGGYIAYCLLAFILLVWLAWALTLWSYTPASGSMKERLIMMLMPQGFILLPVLTWCNHNATAPAAVQASSPLLHTMESMIEAVPSSMALWGVLFTEGIFDRRRRIRGLPTMISPMRRFLWFFTMVSSCTRAVTGVFGWVKANKQGSGRAIRQPLSGLEYMSRRMDPPLSKRTLKRFTVYCFVSLWMGACFVTSLIVTVVARAWV